MSARVSGLFSSHSSTSFFPYSLHHLSCQQFYCSHCRCIYRASTFHSTFPLCTACHDALHELCKLPQCLASERRISWSLGKCHFNVVFLQFTYSVGVCMCEDCIQIQNGKMISCTELIKLLHR